MRGAKQRLRDLRREATMLPREKRNSGRPGRTVKQLKGIKWKMLCTC